ncbi:hypothetical protein B296_00016328 [Ensete ventricosum]|uniref:Uncharacterized protein n=1 Tax=Ensete ventricosum TaxID=4639 RepID=A0A427ARG9_ENSVE|nr:hypothetical protein B296_00016328 [Ensete ventricosum]
MTARNLSINYCLRILPRGAREEPRRTGEGTGPAMVVAEAARLAVRTERQRRVAESRRQRRAPGRQQVQERARRLEVKRQGWRRERPERRVGGTVGAVGVEEGGLQEAHVGGEGGLGGRRHSGVG